jgi:ornithine cyclodeaminase/alanine dehydrogenase-like protein (mu-crystallin family)
VPDLWYTPQLSSVTVAGSRRVLLFGSGRVAKPLMKLMDSLGDVEVTIATEDESQAQDLMSAMGTHTTSGNKKVSLQFCTALGLAEFLRKCL